MPSTWRYRPEKNSSDTGAQIDLLFDRDDDTITICEIKYSRHKYVLTKDYAAKLKQKVDIFKKITSCKKQIFISLICSNGMKKNKYTDELINGVVTLDDLFI